MHAANDYLIAPAFRASSLDPFCFRVGIDSGYVTIGRLGARRRFSSATAIGATANLACRLLELGGSDDILLGDNARRGIPGGWQGRWTEIIGTPTGWTFRLTGLPYPAWRFTGKWARLI